ncbi:MAG: hydroxymethylbilane synthase [Planctomycetales bacterium]|nr:hydroxymethylbilane synthase [Planctomycetales bacterium]
MKRHLKIATRASRLAVAQAELVRQMLVKLLPDCSIAFEEVSTKGDRDRSDFLYKSESVGFFTSEVEQTLLGGNADIAVHSLKDLPTAPTKGLLIAAIPPREPVNDVIVAPTKLASLDDLPKGAVVGTSSIRRIAQLKALRPDLDCQPLRGNIETRLKKVSSGRFFAVVIAQAGLNRLGLSDAVSYALPPEMFLPAPGQGALAIQIRDDDRRLMDIVSRLDDPGARIATQTERRILAGLHGGCSIPLGVFCSIDAGRIRICAALLNTAGTCAIRKGRTCPVSDAPDAADEITRQILDEGGKTILDELRKEKKN